MIFRTNCQALINPVNCMGVMGAGLALQFRRKFPEMFSDYQKFCREGNLRPGTLHHFWEGEKLIINFPTKIHWKDSSRLDWIEAVIYPLEKLLEDEGVKSAAIPALGCGLGGLSYSQVSPLLISIKPIGVRVHLLFPN